MSELRHRAAGQEQRGDYTSAESLLTELVGFADGEVSLDRLQLAADYYNLGMLNLALDRTDRAKRFLLRALAIQKSLLTRVEADIEATREALTQSLVETRAASSDTVDDLICARYVF